MCMQWRLENRTHQSTLFCSFLSCLESFILGQVPSLLLYLQLHDAGCSHRREGRSPVSLYLLQVSTAQAEEAHLGSFCQRNSPELNPYQDEIPESGTQHRWILQEIAVTLTCLALIAEKQPSTLAFLTAEPSVSIPWNGQQRSGLRAKGEIATAQALCHNFLNFLPAARFRKK